SSLSRWARTSDRTVQARRPPRYSSESGGAAERDAGAVDIGGDAPPLLGPRGEQMHIDGVGLGEHGGGHRHRIARGARIDPDDPLTLAAVLRQHNEGALIVADRLRLDAREQVAPTGAAAKIAKTVGDAGLRRAAREPAVDGILHGHTQPIGTNLEQSVATARGSGKRRGAHGAGL